MRCSRRLDPLGAPTWITRSTSPQSMPSSSVEVQTTAREPSLRHGRLHLAALAHVERAVMQGDRQVVVVRLPQRLEDHLGLAARVDEDQRQLCPLQLVVEFRDGIERGMAGPGHALRRLEDADVGCRTWLPHDQRHRRLARRRKPGAQGVGIGDGGREPDAARLRRMRGHARQGQREQHAALRGHHGMQFVEDDGAQVLQQMCGMRIGHHERHLLRRGDQDVGRVLALAHALVLRRVAGAGLDGDGQPHLPDGCLEVAGDVHRQRLERRNIERVDAAAACAAQTARRGWAGSPPASCRHRWARSAARCRLPPHDPAPPADAAAATSRARRTSSGCVAENSWPAA